MPASNKTMIHKLQAAINGKGEQLLIDKIQFFSEDQNRPISLYRISKSVFNPEKGRNKKDKLFETASQIQVVLFLRDYWYYLTGQEIPTDNEMWNEIKKKQGIDFGEIIDNG